MTEFGLNVGCGFRKIQSTSEMTWINLDNSPECTPDKVRDVLRGLPFDDDKFSIIITAHFMEHFGSADFVFLMNELHRVLKPKGELHIISPYYKDLNAWNDPHHKMFFNERTFEAWWFPAMSSQSMGVKGWFLPRIQEIAEEKEIRLIMHKVPNEVLEDYIKKVGVPVAGAHVAPDWLKKLEGTKYPHEGIIK